MASHLPRGLFDCCASPENAMSQPHMKTYCLRVTDAVTRTRDADPVKQSFAEKLKGFVAYRSELPWSSVCLND